MPVRLKIIVTAILSIVCSGCGGSDLTRGKVKELVEAKPINTDQLDDGIYVQLSKAQADCGLREGLWTAAGPDYRDTARSAALGFKDSLAGPPSNQTRDPQAYIIQLRGSVRMKVAEVTGVAQQLDRDTKWASVTLGAVIAHKCFADPLPLIQLVGGQRVTGVPFRIGFVKDDAGWQVNTNRRWWGPS